MCGHAQAIDCPEPAPKAALCVCFVRGPAAAQALLFDAASGPFHPPRILM
jgi:hypothetical protein